MGAVPPAPSGERGFLAGTPVRTGKRYACALITLHVLCIRASPNSPSMCKREMTLWLSLRETFFNPPQGVFQILFSVYHKVTLLWDIIKRRKIVLFLEGDGPRRV